MTRRPKSDTELWAVAIAVLTPRQLHVCRLIWLRNLSIRQTAAMLDIAPSTVTSHLHAARTRIANELRKEAA